MRTLLKYACGLVVLVLAGCAEPAPPIAESKFVDALVALREAAREASDPGAFEERRAEVLREVGVTEAQLRAFVREGARHPRRLADAWDSAAARLSAPPAAEGE